MGEEPGHLPGALDSSQMLEIDLGEHVALFLDPSFKELQIAIIIQIDPCIDRVRLLYIVGPISQHFV
jgi:hypothetical protein